MAGCHTTILVPAQIAYPELSAVSPDEWRALQRPWKPEAKHNSERTRAGVRDKGAGVVRREGDLGSPRQSTRRVRQTRAPGSHGESTAVASANIGSDLSPAFTANPRLGALRLPWEKLSSGPGTP